jgi:hypothetical protein
MAAPTQKPRWATQTQIDPLTGALNKVEPTEEFKLSGLLRREFLARPFLNYQLWLIGQWIDYLSGIVSVGDLETDLSTSNGKYQEISLTEDTTLTESLASGEELVVVIEPNNFLLTWPDSVDFGVAGDPPSNKKSTVRLYKVRNTVYGIQEWSET